VIVTPYILEQDQLVFGVPDASVAQILIATSIINAYLRRPEGLLWGTDGNGLPAYMLNKTPTISVSPTAIISPGTNVHIATNSPFGPQTVGEVVILDRGTTNITEGCTITQVSGNTITLDSVSFTHQTTATIDFGLTISEEVPMPSGRATVRTTRGPIARLISGFGRYGSARRSQQYGILDSNLLAFAGYFGGPPAWTQFPVADCDISYATGQIWIPPGLLLAHFTDVRLHYVAGWSKLNLPPAIKQATANIVRAAIDTPFGGNIKSLKAGNATMERFNSSALSDDTKALLEPYKALLMV
jgi:hypothetical protein